MRPVLSAGSVPRIGRRPEAGAAPAKKRWTFSLRFWKEIKLFGLGDQQGNYFVSLLERLRAVSGYDLEQFLSDSVAKDNFRFHEINWNGKKVPVTRNDFDWLPKEYLGNGEEYPFYQFHVSQALGRIVGFFDENQVFNIVIFDPNHNIQPSNYNDYKIRPTTVGECRYSALVHATDLVLKGCNVEGCNKRAELREKADATALDMSGGVVVCRIEEESHERLRTLRKAGHVDSLADIIELGLLAYETNLS